MTGSLPAGEAEGADGRPPLRSVERQRTRFHVHKTRGELGKFAVKRGLGARLDGCSEGFDSGAQVLVTAAALQQVLGVPCGGRLAVCRRAPG